MLIAVLAVLTGFTLRAQQTDPWLRALLLQNRDSVFRQVTGHPAQYRLQVIYTRINRDSKNIPSFKNYYFNFDTALYFNPASMVKMPLAFLSLEKLHALQGKGIDKYTTVQFDGSEPWQKPLVVDTTTASGHPSIAQFIRRAFLISENDPYNRLYQFMGQGNINRLLHEKGYPEVKITRQFLGLTDEQNRHTNGVRFLDREGRLLYAQPPEINTDSFDFSHEIRLGKAYFDRNDSLIEAPFDFTRQNALSLLSLQQLLQSVLFPASVSPKQRFSLKADDYGFLYKYLSQYPSETPDPKYDTSLFYDSYVKFFFRDSTHRMPAHVRVFNKVGWSYGFLTDVSYVADFGHRVEFMLAATLYANSDDVLNDNKYDYDNVGHPFLYRLGQTIYQYELSRKRKRRPDLSIFKIPYDRRNPKDTRPALSAVDN